MENNRRYSQGYGLIELMCTLSVIGLLSLIIYPSYQAYLIKTKRVEMRVELQHLATQIHAKSLIYGTYESIQLSTIFLNNNAVENNIDTGLSSHPKSQNKLPHEKPNTDLIKPLSTYQDIPFPNIEHALYTVSISPISLDNERLGSVHWKLIATPLKDTVMENDGELSLDYKDKECHRTQCN